MAETWFVGRRGERTGPFESWQMRAMAADGRLAPTDLVWREGMAAWVPAASVADLFAAREPVADGDANPYAAPMMDREVRLAPSGGGVGSVPAGTYSFSAAMALGFQTFKSQWTTLLLFGLVMLGIGSATAVPQWIAQFLGAASGDATVQGFAGLVSGVLGLCANLFVLGPFLAGVVVAAANATEGRGRMPDLFLGFKRYGTVLLTNLLVNAISLGIGLVAVIPVVVALGVASAVAGPNREPAPGLVIAGVLGTLLLVVIGLLVYVRVGCAPAIAADPALGRLGVFESLRLNWSRTSGSRGYSLVGLTIVVSLLMAVSLCLVCVGYLLLGVPFGLAVLGAAYQLLFRCGDTRAAVG